MDKKWKTSWLIPIIGTILVAVILVGGTFFTGRRSSHDTEKAVRNVSLLYLEELAKRREQVVATIIRKDNGRAQYDIEYNGVYYRRWISLSKKAYRRIQIGDKFYALVLPDKLRYDHEGGITPRCFTIILEPLPESQQQIDEENKRIINL